MGEWMYKTCSLESRREGSSTRSVGSPLVDLLMKDEAGGWLSLVNVSALTLSVYRCLLLVWTVSLCLLCLLSVVQDHSPLVGPVATTLAHEMGHNFGLTHDTDTCGCPDDRCIMAPSSGSVSAVHFQHTCLWSVCDWPSFVGFLFCRQAHPMAARVLLFADYLHGTVYPQHCDQLMSPWRLLGPIWRHCCLVVLIISCRW